MPNPGVTLCAIPHVTPERLAAFQAYEGAVPPLLADHGGRSQRRLRTKERSPETQLVWFPPASHVAAYRAAPRRSTHASLFEASDTVAEILTVIDVESRLNVRG